LLSLFFNPEDGGNMFFWNVSWLSTDYTASYYRRQNSQDSLLLSIHFLSKSQNWICAYWVEDIHTAGEVLLLGHSVLNANWILLQAFLEHHQHHHMHSSHGTSTKKCHFAGTPNFSLWHI
jgi:hypothetical protein